MTKPAVNVPYTEADRRYWRTRANLRVRKKRLARHTIRWVALVALHATLLGALAFAGIRIGRHAIRSDEFVLRTVDVRGLARITDDDVERIIEPFFHRNVLELDLDEVAATIEQEAWVREASVRRLLPDGLRIEIRERVPVARVEREDGIVLVDATGQILPIPPGTTWEGLPQITGALDREGPRLARLVREALEGLGGVYETRPDLYAEISGLRIVRDAIEIRLRGGERILLDRSRPARNLETFVALRPEIRRRVGSTDVIDLRWRGRIAVLPAARNALDGTRTGPTRGRSGG